MLFREHFVGNKAKGRISKRVFQESKARQNFRETNISYSLIRTRTCAYVCVSGGKKCLFSGNFGVLCLLETPVSRFALLPNYRRFDLFLLSETKIDESSPEKQFCLNNFRISRKYFETCMGKGYCFM